MKNTTLKATSTRKQQRRKPLRAARGSARMWYYARVKNSSGMHTVFYGKIRPKVGATCGGVAAPNRITGYWRRPEGEAPNAKLTHPGDGERGAQKP